jgi:hypothetical protein
LVSAGFVSGTFSSPDFASTGFVSVVRVLAISCATTSPTRSCQGRVRNAKVEKNFELSSSQLAGRFAALGYSDVEIAATFGVRPVKKACRRTISSAKPCQEVRPVPAK